MTRFIVNQLAANLTEAREDYLRAQALLDVRTAELDAQLPTPADDCTDAEFDAWNDAYCQAEIALYPLQNAVHDCKRAVIEAAWVCLKATGLDTSEAEAVYVAATAQDRRFRSSAFSKMFDVAMRYRPAVAA